MAKVSEQTKQAFCARIGYSFSNAAVLDLALTHSSASDGSKTSDNERLEFLGDRVLGLVVAHRLLVLYPDSNEGILARRLNALVRKEACAEIARDIGLGDVLVMDAAEERSGGREKTAILGDACEALIAGIYLDGGIDAARKFIEGFWESQFSAVVDVAQDPKTALQEWAHRHHMSVPEYEIVSRSGPDHAPVFVIEVRVEGIEPMSGTGPSKRVAEQAAAKSLLDKENKQA
jgi:ribonuclease-3